MSPLQALKATFTANQQLIAKLQAMNIGIEAAIVAQEHFRFVDLPRELRDNVYELCLSRGKVMVGKRLCMDQPRTMHGFHRPDWQLLAVSHDIRREAIQIFFEQNLLVLSSIDHTSHCGLLGAGFYYDEPDMSPKRDISLSFYAMNYLTSLSIALNTINFRGERHNRIEMANSLRCRADDTVSWQNLTDDEKVIATHNEIFSLDILPPWSEIVRSAACPSLKFLQVDITHCYCILGCHRAMTQVCVSNPKLEVLEVLGAKSLTEREYIKNELVEWLSLPYTPDGYGDNRLAKFEDGLQPKLRFQPFLEVLGIDDLDQDPADLAVDSVEFDLKQELEAYNKKRKGV